MTFQKIPFYHAPMEYRASSSKRLVTAALPYVNNVPHLGNLIQVLSADVFARFCRQSGYETLYICGTDEYGTATETRAQEEGITPRELCTRYHNLHKEIYRWFGIQFDAFGRTSTEEHTRRVHEIFLSLDDARYISSHTLKQLYCPTCARFLADRYVIGQCPSCHYEQARGDQCERCGKLLDPSDLLCPFCKSCGKSPRERETRHLYLDLPKALPLLKAWMKGASSEGFWSKNALQMTASWIRDGLREKGITRDLRWGVPVPKEGYEGKVFYVWFDAPIGYISITATHTSQWKKWWRNPQGTRLFQFIGKDNIPFHTVIFPSALLGSRGEWTLLHHLSSSEYLNYEGGKFSKSHRRGVFGSDCQMTGIPADVWRFYLLYNRPEKADYLFTWKTFQTMVNGELIGNFSNLVNRTLAFWSKFYETTFPRGPYNESFLAEIAQREEIIRDKLERVELKEAFKEIFALSSLGNRFFQEGQPWRMRREDPSRAETLLRSLIVLIRDLAILVRPYLPGTSDAIASFLSMKRFLWTDLLRKEETWILACRPKVLFERLEDDRIETLREHFSGQTLLPEEQFSREVALRVGKIVAVKKHPQADRLYVETIDCGEASPRCIVSGLVPYYTVEELLEKHVVVVTNLKAASLRGITSQGMLLAGHDDTRAVDLLTLDQGAPGDPIYPEGYQSDPSYSPKEISIDQFFALPMPIREGVPHVGKKPLLCRGERLQMKKITEGVLK